MDVTALDSFYTDPDGYDTLTKIWNLPSTAELGFYSGMATGLERPILELGCGTGRLSVPLAKLGHVVTGIDCSEEMLSKARTRAKAEGVEVEFLHADARNLKVEPMDRLIISSFNFLAHLRDFDDLRRFFVCVRECMGPRGFLIIEEDSPLAHQIENDPQERRLIGAHLNEQGGQVEFYESCSYDRATQVQKRTRFKHEAGRVTTSTVNTRLFFPQELDNILRMFGFRTLLKLGGFEMQPFTSESERQIVLCSQETRDGQWALASSSKDSSEQQ
jgi:SAM-dependent methyltransferase